jgi:hypothetical protein
MRSVLDKLDRLVIPQAFGSCMAREAFDAQGQLKDGSATRLLPAAGETLCWMALLLARTAIRARV